MPLLIDADITPLLIDIAIIIDYAIAIIDYYCIASDIIIIDYYYYAIITLLLLLFSLLLTLLTPHYAIIDTPLR
jgi:hypothetical protein